MRTWVLCDDRYHPAEVVKQGLEPLLEQGFRFDFTENALEWNADRLKEYPVVLLSKSNHISSENTAAWMTEDIEKDIAGYVEKGGGLLVVHSGTAGYGESRLLRKVLGGVFLRHPEQCDVTVEPSKDSRLSRDIHAFTVKDEHYFMEMDDENADIFMTARSEHGAQPAAWTRIQGRGRVAVLTPGHNLEVWQNPDFQKLLAGMLAWCSGRT